MFIDWDPPILNLEYMVELSPVSSRLSGKILSFTEEVSFTPSLFRKSLLFCEKPFYLPENPLIYLLCYQNIVTDPHHVYRGVSSFIILTRGPPLNNVNSRKPSEMKIRVFPKVLEFRKSSFIENTVPSNKTWGS